MDNNTLYSKSYEMLEIMDELIANLDEMKALEDEEKRLPAERRFYSFTGLGLQRK
jgi:hypothetical protein